MGKKQQPMTLADHLNELRLRLIIIAVAVVAAAIVCFSFANELLELLAKGQTLIFVRPSEAFLAQLRLSVITGLLAVSPLIFYQVTAFIMPALTKKEKRVLIAAVVMMFLLFAAGILFAWFVVFPFALDFFAGFATDQLQPWYTIGDYISFASGFVLAFGVVFQLPLMFWVLGALGIISSQLLRASRKYALLVIAVLSAVITPPDVVSQLLMILPMMILYEVGILLVRLTERRRKRKEKTA